MRWLDQSFRFIQEDRREFYERMMSLMPIASTPMDKQSARSLQNHVRQVEKSLRALTPWKRHGTQRRRSRQQPVGDGEVTVVLDHPAEARLPVFKGAKTRLAGELES